VPIVEGVIAHLFLSVSDTGLASIDETQMPPDITLHFIDTEDNWIVPLFLRSEFHITPQPGSPGDVNDDGIVNLSDVIYLARYLFRGGPEPVFMPSADVNTDCQVNIADAIIIAKWYFFRWVGLQPGCAY